MRREMNTDRYNTISRVFIVLCFIAFAATVRILPHPWNFAPVGAMALFGGAKFPRLWQAFLFPLIALFAGDSIIGFYRLMPIVYLSFCISVLIGILFRKHQTILGLSIATLLGSIQFFLVTNFAVWGTMTSYPPTFSGLMACYTAGIPFFWNTVASDAFYVLILFGGFALVERYNPQLSGPVDSVHTH
jgi:hypothetical protein